MLLSFEKKTFGTFQKCFEFRVIKGNYITKQLEKRSLLLKEQGQHEGPINVSIVVGLFSYLKKKSVKFELKKI